jgi:hypothetical protein
MRAKDGAGPGDGRPDPVGEQRERQRYGGQPRSAADPPGLPEPAHRGVAFIRGQAGNQGDGDSAAVPLGRRV